MNIGELSKISGVSAKLVRHYESIGLIPKAIRTNSGYRVYGENDAHSLIFIKRARNLGFSLPEIKKLLGLWRNKTRASSQVKSLALGHVKEMQSKISELQSMCDTLSNLAKHCHGDHRPDCPILEDLEGRPTNRKKK
ncbi:Cu(I)-responsive transcriptional regulator [Leptospira wolffii]|uniref:Cu(I)-responsive transcriptional regulator n=1 Tax=Leptospira wolffii TaxID=409998 RepID=A0A2M9Z993_9LEPT|nr:Cu(I)-responsive transcriptional regulator [Leptospira wolffii]EPG65655.1 Cu(I)-responsive transcriptional regulator [Leptospira wolffii serovar Khorat str. Khorat-H2]PJZ64953.1 Cu(I)-responsive transcriptional regulator [Leptospira wolffii]TGK58140.1 Cu(I)-responsive transcriptional regulator [Leptospira wolffii]TGK68819.1 Cu(I)-responsive transcriptional regulator [Leptospira wolffii]TGK76341.1 Cu(I)-responsive transcriptional regulator [Leptospira wolffii]